MTGDKETITGTVIRIPFENTETGYRVLKVPPAGQLEPFMVIGNMPDVHAERTCRTTGQEYSFSGQWLQHPQYDELSSHIQQVKDLEVERDRSGRFYVYLRPYMVD